MDALRFTHRDIPVGDGTVHVVEAGRDNAESVVLLHGWPQDHTAWRRVMELAGETHHVVTLDLPGIGRSSGIAASGEKVRIADTVHDVVHTLDLDDYVVVGHDIGAMVAYAHLRKYADELGGAVLLSSAIPGIAPWDTVLSNRHIWHFAFHAVPDLPEELVAGSQRAYFDYFFDALTADAESISSDDRDHYAAAYACRAALRTGFDWYRAFGQDAEANRTAANIRTPLRYLRGDQDEGDASDYVNGFHEAGVVDVTTGRIPGSKHFIPDENPEALWEDIAAFVTEVRTR